MTNKLISDQKKSENDPEPGVFDLPPFKEPPRLYI